VRDSAFVVIDFDRIGMRRPRDCGEYRRARAKIAWFASLG
jgi:hypothetical protein